MQFGRLGYENSQCRLKNTAFGLGRNSNIKKDTILIILPKAISKATKFSGDSSKLFFADFLSVVFVSALIPC